MATIAVTNYNSKTYYDPADIDNDSNLVVGQVGGTNGQGSVSVGNLDATNIAVNAAFTNAQKAQPYSIFQLAFEFDSPNSGAANNPRVVVPTAARLLQVAITGTFSPVGTYSYSVKINGQTATTIPGAHGLNIPLDLPVNRGDVISVDDTGAPVGYVFAQITLLLKAEHVGL